MPHDHNQGASIEADANAPWLTSAHIICADAGIPPGEITWRLEVLRGLMEADRAEIADLRAQLAAKGQGRLVGWTWYEPASEWNGYQGRDHIAFDKPKASAARHGCQPLYLAAPASAQPAGSTPLADLWMHEDMDRDAMEAALNSPRKELKDAHRKAVDDLIYWKRRALTAEAGAQPDQRESAAVPDGWKLVPVEPTAEMLVAGAESEDKDFGIVIHNCYVAMLAASPAAQPAKDERIEITREGNMFWHTNCAKNRFKSGVMKEVRREPSHSMIECQHCGKAGFYPVGGVGRVCVDEIVQGQDSANNGADEQKGVTNE